MRLERIQIPQKRAVIGPPAKLQLMALVALESISVRKACILGVQLWDFTGVCGRGALCPQSSLDPRMREDYAFVCVYLISLSVCLSVCLSISVSLYVYACLSACLSFPPSPPPLSLSLSICGVDLADQGSRARYRAIQVFIWDSKSGPFRLTSAAGRSPLS